MRTETSVEEIAEAHWYHSNSGFYFAKLAGGKVIVATKDDFKETPKAYAVMEPSEWASVVAFVSTLGDTGPQQARAYVLHRRGTEEPALAGSS